MGLVKKGNYIDGEKHVNLQCLVYATERYFAALSKIFLTTPRITFRCGQKLQGKRKKGEFKNWKMPHRFLPAQRKWLPRVCCILAEKGQKMRYIKGSISNKMRGRRTNIRQPRGLPDMNSWMSSNRFSQYNTPSGNVIMEGCDVQKHLQHYVADRFQTSCCYCLAKLARLKARRF